MIASVSGANGIDVVYHGVTSFVMCIVPTKVLVSAETNCPAERGENYRSAAILRRISSTAPVTPSREVSTASSACA